MLILVLFALVYTEAFKPCVVDDLVGWSYAGFDCDVTATTYSTFCSDCETICSPGACTATELANTAYYCDNTDVTLATCVGNCKTIGEVECECNGALDGTDIIVAPWCQLCYPKAGDGDDCVEVVHEKIEGSPINIDGYERQFYASPPKEILSEPMTFVFEDTDEVLTFTVDTETPYGLKSCEKKGHKKGDKISTAFRLEYYLKKFTYFIDPSVVGPKTQAGVKSVKDGIQKITIFESSAGEAGSTCSKCDAYSGKCDL